MLVGMSSVLERSVTITPGVAATGRTRTGEWTETVWSFLDRAAAQGASVQLTMVDRTFSPTEVATMCDVSRATLTRRIQDGTIKAVRRGSRWRVPKAEVDRYRKFMMAQAASAMADDF
jgi:excisionase family DNA binding protein